MAFGYNIDQRKINKRNYIIDLFRQEGLLSKAQAKDLSGYSMDTVLSIFSSLLEDGLIEEADGRQKPKGRRATFFRLRAEEVLYLGITYNQRGIFSSVVSFSDTIVATHETQLDIGVDVDSFRKIFIHHIEEVFDSLDDDRARVSAIGCAIPGGRDAESGILLRYTFMPFTEEIDFRILISEAFPGIDVEVEQNAMSMASYFLHDASLMEKYERILFVSARAGTVSGLIFDGHVVAGNGEFGHVRVADDPALCACGRSGCLDCYFSLQAFSELLVTRGLAKEAVVKSGTADLSLLGDLYAKGEHDIVIELDRRLAFFCSALLDVINVTVPNLVILSGELLAIYGSVEEKIREIIASRFPDTGFVRHYENTELLFSPLGPEMAAQGICYRMIRDGWGYVGEK